MEGRKKIVAIVMGSEVDRPHAEKIAKGLNGITVEIHAASAHKEPRKVLSILENYEAMRKESNAAVVYVTIAGRSNALSGFVAANSTFPTLACPPFADKVDMMVNVNSTLQMPSNVPAMTVLDPSNCAQAAKRILDLIA